MSVAFVEQVGPWSEEDYFALGETPNRIELFDGSLLVSPAPPMRHQRVAHRLASLLDGQADAIKFRVFSAVYVRLDAGRILVPDIVITSVVDGNVVEARDVVLVGEVVSPGSAGTDRILKRLIYAAAGIGWYLLAEPGAADSMTLRLLRLDGGHYIEYALAEDGETLTSDDPLPIAIETSALLRRR